MLELGVGMRRAIHLIKNKNKRKRIGEYMLIVARLLIEVARV